MMNKTKIFKGKCISLKKQVKSPELKLPNGMVLIAEENNDPSYPGIQISLKGAGIDDTNEVLCFVEYNSEKDTGKELCICVYTHNQDDYVYYASYHETAKITAKA